MNNQHHYYIFKLFSHSQDDLHIVNVIIQNTFRMNYICQVLVLVSILIHMVFSHPILPATGGATATKTEVTLICITIQLYRN